MVSCATAQFVEGLRRGASLVDEHTDGLVDVGTLSEPVDRCGPAVSSAAELEMLIGLDLAVEPQESAGVRREIDERVRFGGVEDDVSLSPECRVERVSGTRRDARGAVATPWSDAAVGMVTVIGVSPVTSVNRSPRYDGTAAIRSSCRTARMASRSVPSSSRSLRAPSTARRVRWVHEWVLRRPETPYTMPGRAAQQRWDSMPQERGGSGPASRLRYQRWYRRFTPRGGPVRGGPPHRRSQPRPWPASCVRSGSVAGAVRRPR